jgi:signal peptidase I
MGLNAIAHKRGWKLFARDLIVIVLVAVLASICIKNFVLRSFFIPSGSMEATLQINDRIFVNELPTTINRGDVVVFTDPGGWLSDNSSSPRNPLFSALNWVGVELGIVPGGDNHLIKRVIGLAGDRVECCNALGQISVNGVPLREPYLQLPAGQAAASGTPFSVVVPRDSFWVMGDNRYLSADSRAQVSTPSKGFVPRSAIVGKAVLIIWPLSRVGWIDSHGDVFSRPRSAGETRDDVDGRGEDHRTEQVGEQALP